jgi:type 1 glutamine amidotransferase
MIRNLLLTGGPPSHDFAAIAESLDRVFVGAGVETTVIARPDDMISALLSSGGGTYDLLTVHALHWRMEAERYEHLREGYAYSLSDSDAEVIREFVAGGGGLLALHAAVVCFDAEPTWHALCGASWHWERSSHPPADEAEVVVTDQGRVHPITEGLDNFTILDEVYGFLDEDPALVALLEGSHGGRSHPLLWARGFGAGRVVTDLLGHGVESFDCPAHIAVLQRAALWASRYNDERLREQGTMKEGC